MKRAACDEVSWGCEVERNKFDEEIPPSSTPARGRSEQTEIGVVCTLLDCFEVIRHGGFAYLI